jgi:excisionase family DNA binding protein
MTEKFLSTRDISEKLGISMNRVRQLIRKAELPGLYDGYTYLIPESEFLRWMDSHKIRRQQ